MSGNTTIGGLTATPGTGPGNVISGNDTGISIIDYGPIGVLTIQGNILFNHGAASAGGIKSNLIFAGNVMAQIARNACAFSGDVLSCQKRVDFGCLWAYPGLDAGSLANKKPSVAAACCGPYTTSGSVCLTPFSHNPVE